MNVQMNEDDSQLVLDLTHYILIHWYVLSDMIYSVFEDVHDSFTMAGIIEHEMFFHWTAHSNSPKEGPDCQLQFITMVP